jgi:LmbE family N-acetylglucosaminyl deacetylase
LGDLGSIDGQPDLSPAKVAEVRRQEFTKAMTSLGIAYEVFEFGDFSLSTMPFRNIALPLLNSLREKDLAAVFTFHPYEITPNFDHPDHNLTGEATRFAASGQDVKNLKVGSLADGKTEFPATTDRPELYFWTTNEDQATHQLKIGKKSSRRRQKYLSENYPSQFPRQTKKRWGTIFDRFGKKEYYQQVR